MTRQNEEHILRDTVTALLTINGTVSLCYEADYDTALTINTDTPWEGIAEGAFACDSCTLRVGAKWVYFVWDNGNDGLDCIADHTVSLEDVLKPVMRLVDEMKGDEP
jgi:hypothetical protein